MADYAHQKTDEEIERIKKRVAKEYRQAAKEAEKKMTAYLERFESEDKKQLQLVKEGKMTKKAYNEWRARKIATGERWEGLKKTLAEDYHNRNQIAASITSGRLPDVYAVNHNYATYMIEKEGRIDTSFTLYNHDSVERLIKDNPKLLPDPSADMAKKLATAKDLRWNEEKIQSSVLQGILLGEPTEKIARRMMDVSNMNYKAAVRNARTAMTSAQNAGRNDAGKRAEEMGIDLVYSWVSTLDNRTRDSHRWLHGEERDEKSGTFSNGLEYPADPSGDPSEVYNCRCTMISHIAGIPFGIPKSSPDIADMTFEEWQAGKKAEEREKAHRTGTSSLTKGTTAYNKTGSMSKDDYLFAKRAWEEVEEIRLPKQEYAQVISELNTHLSDEDRTQPLIHKEIGDYRYSAVNLGFNQYKIYKKDRIDDGYIDEVLGE